MLTKEDLRQIEKIVEKKIGPLDNKIKQMDKKINIILHYFDDKYLDHESRLERIEGHLHFSS